MTSNKRRPALSAALLALLGLAAQGCSSGSGGSDVGRANLSPIARPLLVNTGASSTVREGAEVLLTGRDSEDPDGPIIDWTWSGPTEVRLVTRNRTTASFTAPPVDAATLYTFALTVVDADGETDTAEIDVEVVPARDSNRFLAPRAGQVANPDTVRLTVALEPDTAVGLLDAPFTVTLTATASYLNRSGVQEQVALDIAELAAPIVGQWPAGQTVECAAGQPRTQCMLASWINPRYYFRVPRLDIAKLNQRFLDSGELDRQLDAHRVDGVVVEVTATLDAGVLQDKAVLLLSNEGALIAQSPHSIIGIPASVAMTTDELLAALGAEEHGGTAAAYYRTVDPFGRRQTLNDWLFMAGFAADANGALLPEAVAGAGEFAHVKYTNNFDLGFGRDMYARVEPNGNVYAFVVNYPTLEAAIRNTDSFVTVVMEFTPPDDPALHTSCLDRGRFVKFFTYIPDRTGNSPRVGTFDFDGRGERQTPGNCIACHGGALGDLSRLVPNPAVPGQTLYRACGDTGATFLPWDLDSFLFSNTDPAILAGLPRPDGTSFVDYTDPQARFRREPQQEQFRKLNAAALSTWETYVAEGGDPQRLAAAVDLVHGWYGGEPHTPGARFDGTYTPPGWDASAAIAQLYHTAFARHCRACHLQLVDSSKQLASYQDLILNPLTGSPRPLEDLIYRRGTMPFARLTMDRFWVPFEGGAVPAQTLAQQLADDLGLDPTLRPGRPVFSVTRAPVAAKHGDIVRLSARNSFFVRQPQWSALSAADGAACLQPTLAGAGTLEVTFRADAPGRYCMELASDGERVVEAFEVVPNQPPQLVTKDRLTVDENAGPTAVDLEYADGDDPPTAIVFTLAGTLNGVVSVSGSEAAIGAHFTQPQIDAGEVRFEPRLPGNLGEGALAVGGFDYAVTDGIATLGPPAAPALEYRVDIRGASDTQPAVTVQPVPPSELYFGGTAEIGARRIHVQDPDTAPEDLSVAVALSSGAAGSVTPPSLTYRQLLDGAAFTYTHDGDAVSQRLLVTVTDGTSTSSHAPLVVNARVSFEHNLIPIVNAACASGCHVGGPLSFRAGGQVTHSAFVTETRVVFPENACIGPHAPPSSPLLRKPTLSADVPPPAGHVGGVRTGFDLAGDRSSYDVLRLWICNSLAADN